VTETSTTDTAEVPDAPPWPTRRGFFHERRDLAIGLGLALVILVVIVATGEKQALVIGTISGAAYGLVAIGLVLIYKSSGVFNFAQGEFGTVALFALYLFHFHVPYGVAVAGALIVALLMGLLVERLIIRPLFTAPRVILLVATAGVALLTIGIEVWFGGTLGKNVDRALPELNRVTIFGLQISDQRLLLIGTLIVLAIVLGLFFSRTNLGLAIIGASQEPTATELVGISVRRLSSFTWAMSAVLGGLAAILAVPETGSFTPGVMTSSYLIPAFTAAVLGGMTSLPGAFLGGVLIGVIQSIATSGSIFDDIPGTPSTLLVFIVLVLVLVVRPQGLLGKKA
jgi:branched-chain amino acid transport system permease protein